MRYELLIPVLFFGAMLVCHWTLRWDKVRNNELLWVIVEYVWLAGAVLALVSAASELRRLNLQRDGQTKRDELLGEWNKLRISARSALEIGGRLSLGCGGAEKTLESDCRSVMDWFKYAASSLELGVENERWRTFLHQNADVDPIEISKPHGASQIPQFPHWDFERLPKSTPRGDFEFAQELLVRMHKLDELRTEVHAIEAKTNLQWYDVLCRSVVPWFLTIALALKITKNSVQYRKVRNSTRERDERLRDESSITTEKPSEITGVRKEMEYEAERPSVNSPQKGSTGDPNGPN